ncbi:MAG: hypothetical protein V4555_12680 [Acidobacteriota bacterium]
MTLRACSREKDVAEMLRAGHWPAACAEELREHVRGCRKCGDMVLVGEAMQSAKVRSAGPRMDAAGVIWWRAQLRRKTAAMEAISRPMLGAQVFAMLLAVVAVAGLLVIALRQGAVSRVATAIDQASTGWVQSLGMGSLLGGGMMAVLVGAMVVLAGCFAVYVALDRR